MLDGWLDAVRLAQATVDPPDRLRSEVDAVVEGVAAASDTTLDRSTLRAMAFAVAASQAVQVLLTPASPGDSDFPNSVLDSISALSDFIVRRLDSEART